MDAMHQAGIDVIIGTPTYAIPSWLEKMHPEVIADTQTGRRPYGARQIMDITSPAYLFYAERDKALWHCRKQRSEDVRTVSAGQI